MKSIFLSIVVPSYNEVKNIEAGVLYEMWEYLKPQKYSWEVILADDGSNDETLELLKKFASDHKGFVVSAQPHRGKAGTVIGGILEAKGDIVLFTDMDQATALNQVERILPKFEEGFDGVIGSRHGRAGYPIIRKMMAYGFMILRKIILNLPYKDTQCGFKAFKREVAVAIFERMKVFNDKQKETGAAVTAGFDLEILYIARKLRFRIAEVQIEWHEKGIRKEVRPIKDSWDGLRDLIKVRINAFRGEYR